jgi:hypothetical protein
MIEQFRLLTKCREILRWASHRDRTYLMMVFSQNLEIREDGFVRNKPWPGQTMIADEIKEHLAQ